MPNLSLLNFDSLVQLGSAACQRASQRVLNFKTGSVLRATVEASASLATWIEYLIVQVYLGTRLSTSSGTDVDSFVGDFFLTRQPSVPATGLVTLSRFYGGIPALVPPYFNVDGTTNPNGLQVLTLDRTQMFGVTVDTSHVLWNAGLGGYLIPTGTSSADVPVKALVGGAAGNIQSGFIAFLTTSVPGVDQVTNATAFGNGVDQESDASLKTRFQIFIATRARATLAAVANAVQTVQQNLSYAIIENTLPNGEPHSGFFTVTVDDGTGTPTTALLQAVYAAVDTVRPLGSQFTVQPPAIVYASINMTITASAGYQKTDLQGQVATVIENYVNGLGIGKKLSYTRLSALAYGVNGVATVDNVLLNGGTFDVGGGPTQVVKATGASVVIN